MSQDFRGGGVYLSYVVLQLGMAASLNGCQPSYNDSRRSTTLAATKANHSM